MAETEKAITIEDIWQKRNDGTLGEFSPMKLFRAAYGATSKHLTELARLYRTDIADYAHCMYGNDLIFAGYGMDDNCRKCCKKIKYYPDVFVKMGGNVSGTFLYCYEMGLCKDCAAKFEKPVENTAFNFDFTREIKHNETRGTSGIILERIYYSDGSMLEDDEKAIRQSQF